METRIQFYALKSFYVLKFIKYKIKLMHMFCKDNKNNKLTKETSFIQNNNFKY